MMRYGWRLRVVAPAGIMVLALMFRFGNPYVLLASTADLPGLYYALNRYALYGLLAVNAGMLICACLWLAAQRMRRRPAGYSLCGMLALTLLTVAALTGETNQQARAKNREYLTYLGTIANRYYQQHGALPESFTAALAESGRRLPQRGDADGNGVAYRRMDDRTAVWESCGADGRWRTADDITVEVTAMPPVL
ncbi:MAG TPA: hypothetical protein PKM88_04120 [bacterium]|nr:hypothetical protein [bacterium]